LFAEPEVVAEMIIQAAEVFPRLAEAGFMPFGKRRGQTVFSRLPGMVEIEKAVEGWCPKQKQKSGN